MAKTLFILVAGGLLIAGWAMPASAIEMFTNFNNGMELGTRPLGVPEFPPVRFHSWQPQRWYDRHGMCRPSEGEWRFNLPPSPPSVVPPPSVPQANQAESERIDLHGEPMAGTPPMPTDHEDIDWLRGQSFLPLGTAN